ncbi:hypothetical protein CJD36_010540 [Flavipsychrobacter stenotrophus]|uniref:Secretion system C-terminal sorting domain-containing protein n=1 Tax=Flavipsychrobacter stenotrophus TaxID=2077091 RepID=A0A2S7SUV4_9BACT|nr:T9SS type A sorting domain-containing protein [Flavipsychrobacter stenotrophus]PQJ10407.1 hypothetical protein CJD36_010540 [Flavipsychrobacter stenotrophus]
MKKRALLLPLAGIFLYVTLSSYASGYGSNRTGSHGSTVGCGSCHGSTASGIAVTFELDSAGTPVTRYKPGMSYTLKMTGTNNTTATNLNGFGCQLSVISGSGTSSVNAGTMSGAPASTGFNAGTGGINFLEHSSRIAATTGGGAVGSTYVISVSWTAPAAGTGTVKAYGLINAVNCNGNDGGGDYWNSANTSFTELPAGANVSVANVTLSDLNVYPNPVNNILNISGYQGAIAIFDVNGKVVATENATNANTMINTSAWAAGMYMVTLQNNGIVTTRTIVKN